MSVVLWDINVSKRLKSGNLISTPETEAKMYSLDEYYKIAHHCISAFASPSLAWSMLCNEDAISFIAEHLMYASCRWKKDGGRSLYCYLNQCAIWAIRRWILISRNSNIHNENFCDTIPDEMSDQPIDELCRHEEELAIHTIINTKLTGHQKECIELIYIQGYTGSEVARRLNISRQAVEQCITRSIAKIKASLNEQFYDRFKKGK